MLSVIVLEITIPRSPLKVFSYSARDGLPAKGARATATSGRNACVADYFKVSGVFGDTTAQVAAPALALKKSLTVEDPTFTGTNAGVAEETLGNLASALVENIAFTANDRVSAAVPGDFPRVSRSKTHFILESVAYMS